FKSVAAALALLLATPAAAQAPAWDPQPWVEDLAQIRAAMDAKYANMEWLLTERELDLPALFERAERGVRNAGSDAAAAAIFDRLMTRIGDGHVGLSWPRPASPAADSAAPATPAPAPTAQSFCRSIGYDGAASPGLAPAVPGYAALPDSSEVLPAGTATIGGVRTGFLRIAIFQPQGSPALCTQAVAALAIPIDRPCDDECRNRIVTHAYRALGEAMMDRLARLKAAGAQALVVDISGNGGGSEWTEAAARMLSRRPLRSAPVSFVRGEHWVANWQRVIDQLSAHRERATGGERRQLDTYLAQARAFRAEAARTCPPAGACSRLAPGGYATGLVAQAPAGSFASKDWAVWVFNPAQHNYRDGTWDGPVVVLTDQDTASAAEQFAAILQDNRAALILGARTAGAGCGHTWGGTPTRLANSGATLRLPDCTRFRADGSNEVRGILPDVAIPWRANDGRAFRARLLEAALPEALARARALHHAR
ncbi:MAG TPA: S41 family peptidase, partial [Geminicoccaceae bacterium]